MPKVRELIVQYRAHPAGIAQDDRIYADPTIAAGLLTKLLENEPVENFVVLHLDAKNRLIAIQTVARGQTDRCEVSIRSIIGAAIASHNSVRLILAHNHPSGDPTPSVDDLEITRKVRQAGILFALEVLDHIIIGNGTYCSLRQTGRMEYL